MSFDDAQPYINQVRVNWKIMSQLFNPDYYTKNDSLLSVIKRRFNSDLMTSFSTSVKFAVISNHIKFFDYWFIDLRDFSFFIPGYIENNPKMNLREVSFDPLGQSIFNKNLIKNIAYGYY